MRVPGLNRGALAPPWLPVLNQYKSAVPEGSFWDEAPAHSNLAGFCPGLHNFWKVTDYHLLVGQDRDLWVWCEVICWLWG